MAEPDVARELSEIRRRLDEMENVLLKVHEVSVQPDAPQAFDATRSDLLEVMVSQAMDDVEDGLSKNMVKRCDMKEPCRAMFTAFLQKNAALLERDTVREEVIITNQDELDRMKETSPYDKCSKCLEEVARLFGKQVRLMRSLRIYSSTTEKRAEIAELPEETVVREVLDPLSSPQRLQILKAISEKASTFSTLSDITGLKGGNLLFHIQRLLKAGMVAQRHDRGDYMITEKGFKVLKGVNDVYQTLRP